MSGLREERGLSIEEMARLTRVASRYLEALEREDLGVLPASVFTKGYIRAYCQALGVHADEALERYAAAEAPAVAAVAAPADPAKPSSARRPRGTLLVSFALLVGFGAALFAVALYLQSGRPEVGTRQGALSVPIEPKTETTPRVSTPAPPPAPPEARAAPIESPPVAPVPAAPSAATPVAAAPTPVRPPEPRAAAPIESRPAAETARAAVAAPALALHPGSVVSPYRLIARTSESTWLRVRTEDGRTMEETIPAGEIREWVSNRPFVLTVGNAAGVSLELNGQKLPPLGGRGVVIGNLVLPPPTP